MAAFSRLEDGLMARDLTQGYQADEGSRMMCEKNVANGQESLNVRWTSGVLEVDCLLASSHYLSTYYRAGTYDSPWSPWR